MNAVKTMAGSAVESKAGKAIKNLTVKAGKAAKTEKAIVAGSIGAGAGLAAAANKLGGKRDGDGKLVNKK